MNATRSPIENLTMVPWARIWRNMRRRSSGTYGTPTTRSSRTRMAVSDVPGGFSARKSAYSLRPVLLCSARISRAMEQGNATTGWSCRWGTRYSPMRARIGRVPTETPDHRASLRPIAPFHRSTQPDAVLRAAASALRALLSARPSPQLAGCTAGDRRESGKPRIASHPSPVR